MQIRGSALKLTAVSALVVLALTGFSTGRGHRSGGDSDGGGCSSSSQNHDSSSVGKYDDDDDYDDGYGGGYDSDGSGSSGSDSGSGQSGTTLEAATVELVTCATPDQPYATVEVTNPNSTEGVFDVTVGFEDAAATEITTQHKVTRVPAYDTVTVQVDLGSGESRAADVDHCEAAELAPATV
ncbi:hypothetical protein [Streptomyces flavalbus]|uniref:Secreted protein n=1 Tax=Streptomyces flavalbus TaxID=2665155 RepID=A0ABW2WDS0_9ACTN